MSGKQSVVVVGGGGAGHAVARTLSQKLSPSTHSLTLVTARPFFVHLPAAIRMTTTAQGKLEETALVPYDKLLVNKNGTVKTGRVVGIETKETKGGVVVLENGERIPYDVLVLATGSHWQGPINLPDDREGTLSYIKQWRSKFENASSIVLAGGGAVGCEFAGEIKDYFPRKKVTLVHGGSSLFNDTYPDKFRNKHAKELRARGVNLVFNDYIDDFEQTGSIVTRGGNRIEGDLIVPCVGGRPVTEFIGASLGSSVLNERGQVRVKPTLQLNEHPAIFAAGDITDLHEQKQFAKYPKHAEVIAANVLSYLKNGTANKRYGGQPEMIIVTNGAKGGTAFVGMGWGMVMGNWMSSTMKSKDLFVPMVRKGLGMPS